MKKLIPLNERVLIKRKEMKEEKKLIMINEEKSPYFEVVAVAKEVTSVKRGQTILSSEYTIRLIKLDEEDYYIVKEEDILAICEV